MLGDAGELHWKLEEKPHKGYLDQFYALEKQVLHNPDTFRPKKSATFVQQISLFLVLKWERSLAIDNKSVYWTLTMCLALC